MAKNNCCNCGFNYEDSIDWQMLKREYDKTTDFLQKLNDKKISIKHNLSSSSWEASDSCGVIATSNNVWGLMNKI